MNSESIKFRCPGCKKKISTSRANIGTNGICPDCGTPLVVPKPSGLFQRKLIALVTVAAILVVAVALFIGRSGRVQPTQEGVTKQLKRQGFKFMHISDLNSTNPDGSNAGTGHYYICAKRSPAIKAFVSLCERQEGECIQVMIPLNAAKDCVVFAKSLSSELESSVHDLIDKPLPPRELKIPGGYSLFTVTNYRGSPDGKAIVIGHVFGDRPYPKDAMVSDTETVISLMFGGIENVPLPE